MRYHVLRPAAGESVEKFLLHLTGLGPRAALKKAFAAKAVQLNGRPVARTVRVAEGDVVEILSPELWSLYERATMRATVGCAPVPAERMIVQSAQMLVIDKPAGQASHPLRPSETDTALNALAAIDPGVAEPLRELRPLEGALVHRLDRGTSGLLVCARTPESWILLRDIWASRASSARTQRPVEKVYVAWLAGDLKFEGRLELTLTHDPKSKKRMTANPVDGTKSWAAKTSIRTLRVTPDRPDSPLATLALVRIHTGVTHQIRVTAAHLGHPVLGDELYLGVRSARLAPEALPLDRETAAVFDKLGERLAGLSAPRFEFCPSGGFFLHAYWLRSEGLAELTSGILAPMPEHFGLRTSDF